MVIVAAILLLIAGLCAVLALAGGKLFGLDAVELLAVGLLLVVLVNLAGLIGGGLPARRPQ